MDPSRADRRSANQSPDPAPAWLTRSGRGRGRTGLAGDTGPAHCRQAPRHARECIERRGRRGGAMRTGLTRTGRRLLVPEVVQTSAMDCGPAALKCLLEGFGIPVSYGRLREACQTDVDGTSIDTLEEVAQQLGLEAEQVMLPVDHLLHR